MTDDYLRSLWVFSSFARLLIKRVGMLMLKILFMNIGLMRSDSSLHNRGSFIILDWFVCWMDLFLGMNLSLFGHFVIVGLILFFLRRRLEVYVRDIIISYSSLSNFNVLLNMFLIVDSWINNSFVLGTFLMSFLVNG